jgi:hypothetical protein
MRHVLEMNRRKHAGVLNNRMVSSKIADWNCRPIPRSFMTRLLIATVLATGLLAFSTQPATAHSGAGLSEGASVAIPLDDSKPCKTKNFKTKMIKAACAKGGQKAAAKAWDKWTKGIKKKLKKADPKAKFTCKNCHASLKPEWKLKKTALATFKKHGGS